MEGGPSFEGERSEGELIAEINEGLLEANKLLCGDFSREVFDKVTELLEDDELLKKIGKLSNPDQVKELEIEYQRLVDKAIGGMKVQMTRKFLKASASALGGFDRSEEARA